MRTREVVRNQIGYHMSSTVSLMNAVIQGRCLPLEGITDLQIGHARNELNKLIEYLGLNNLGERNAVNVSEGSEAGSADGG